MKFEYQAMQVRQTGSGKRLTMFAAPATEVNEWAGVPQKKRFGTDAETAGFQREENAARIESLREFYSNDENIIQNPLLCAMRNVPPSSLKFSANEGAPEGAEVEFGRLTIEIPEFSALSLPEIIGRVRAYIEQRVPELTDKQLNPELIATLKEKAQESGHLAIGDDEYDESEGSEEQTEEEGSDEEASAALFEESHIIDFWQELAGRDELLKEIGDSFRGDEFLGFTKQALISYLCPVVLVDGQHRLRGALKAAESKLTDPGIQDEIEQRISNGEAAEAVSADIIRKQARRLPLSLLMSDEPSEQVFQFIVVNQKATPIGRALLGTIVSTSLSNEEMNKVAGRLKDAGIQLEEAQAVTFLARHPDSPFYNKVERGLAGDPKDLLQWNVFASLIGVFRDLKGGRLFGQRNDYADRWQHKFLIDSSIIAEYQEKDFETPYDYWRQLDGPWRDVFVQFWTKIRDEFSDQNTPDTDNFWGKPRESNLFNKISLTILAADFFQFLCETRKTIDDANSIGSLVDDWLLDVSRSYFARDWKLMGVKKDSTGIRNQWASLWSEYRKNPAQLPRATNYRQAKGE